MDILELETEMQNTSLSYKFSTAFQRALEYIKKTNKDLYAELVEKECEECGIL